MNIIGRSKPTNSEHCMNKFKKTIRQRPNAHTECYYSNLKLLQEKNRDTDNLGIKAMRIINFLILLIALTSGIANAEQTSAQPYKIQILTYSSCGTVSHLGQVEISATDNSKLVITPHKNCKAGLAIDGKLKTFENRAGTAIKYPLKNLKSGSRVEALLIPKNRPFTSRIIIEASNETPAISRSRKIKIDGTVSSSYDVKNVSWVNITNGKSGKARGGAAWNANIPLVPGKNNIVFSALSPDNLKAKTKLQVKFDRTSPFESSVRSSVTGYSQGISTQTKFSVDITSSASQKVELIEISGTLGSGSAHTMGEVSTNKGTSTYAVNLPITPSASSSIFKARVSRGQKSWESNVISIPVIELSTEAEVANHFNFSEKVNEEYRRLSDLELSEYEITHSLYDFLKSQDGVYDPAILGVGALEWRTSPDKPLLAQFTTPRNKRVFSGNEDQSVVAKNAKSLAQSIGQIRSQLNGSSLFISPYYKNTNAHPSNSFGYYDMLAGGGFFGDIYDELSNSCRFDISGLKVKPQNTKIESAPFIPITIEDFKHLGEEDVTLIFSHGGGSSTLLAGIYPNYAEYHALLKEQAERGFANEWWYSTELDLKDPGSPKDVRTSLTLRGPFFERNLPDDMTGKLMILGFCGSTASHAITALPTILKKKKAAWMGYSNDVYVVSLNCHLLHILRSLLAGDSLSTAIAKIPVNLLTNPHCYFHRGLIESYEPPGGYYLPQTGAKDSGGFCPIPLPPTPAPQPTFTPTSLPTFTPTSLPTSTPTPVPNTLGFEVELTFGSFEVGKSVALFIFDSLGNVADPVGNPSGMPNGSFTVLNGGPHPESHPQTFTMTSRMPGVQYYVRFVNAGSIGFPDVTVTVNVKQSGTTVHSNTINVSQCINQQECDDNFYNINDTRAGPLLNLQAVLN